MLNLLVNAQQALEQGRGTDRRISIGIDVDRDGGSVALTVDDNGPGVPAAIRNRVFDPFSRRSRRAPERAPVWPCPAVW